MAIDTYTVFHPYDAAALTGSSQISFPTPATADPFPGGGELTGRSFFPISGWSNNVEQTLNIGSQSSGAGAGKITFEPFSITRTVDLISETLFTMCASGTAFQYVDLIQRRSIGTSGSAATFLAYRFGLVAVKSISWAYSTESPQETVAFEYGQLTIGFATQNPNGTYNQFVFAGWDRVKNVRI
jgi:type VI protein secretion system component Hcp